MKTNKICLLTVFFALFWVINVNAQKDVLLYETDFTDWTAMGASSNDTQRPVTTGGGTGFSVGQRAEINPTGSWCSSSGFFKAGNESAGAMPGLRTKALEFVQGGVVELWICHTDGSSNRTVRVAGADAVMIELPIPGAGSNRQDRTGIAAWGGSATSPGIAMGTSGTDRPVINPSKVGVWLAGNIFACSDNTGIYKLSFRLPTSFNGFQQVEIDAYRHLAIVAMKIWTNPNGPSLKEFTLDGITVTTSPPPGAPADPNGIVQVTGNYTGTVTINNIPYTTNLASIVPSIVFGDTNTDFANASDATANNKFTMVGGNPLQWTASYELKDITSSQPNRTYTVVVNKIQPTTCSDVRINNDFKVVFRGNTINGVIDNNSNPKKIAFTIPFTTTLAELQSDFAPVFTTNGILCTGEGTLSSGCLESATTASGATFDFSQSIIHNQGVSDGSGFNAAQQAKYVLMPQNGTSCEYVVEITRAAPDIKCNITEFYFDGYAEYKGVINGTNILLTLPATADITNLTAVVSDNSLAAIAIVAALPTNYTTPQNITVRSEKAEAGIAPDPGEEIEKTYTVTVTTDGTAPLLRKEDSRPVDGAQDVSLAGVVRLEYDEDLVKGAGDIILQEKGGANPVTIPLTAITISGQEARFNFSGLTSLTEYEIIIPQGIFTDKYGNEVAAEKIEFKTADGVNRTFPNAMCMNGEDFGVPAFITGSNYLPDFDTKATTPNQYGAYMVAVGSPLTITTERVGSVIASIYALGGGRSATITVNTGTISNISTEITTSGAFSYYENKGGIIGGKIDNAGTTIVTITATGGTIYVPYIYISDVNETAQAANQACCQ